MPATFRLDLHRRLWIALSNPYWYQMKICSHLYIRMKAHVMLHNYDPNFSMLSIYSTGDCYGCYVAETCSECPLRTTCRDIRAPKMKTSLLTKWVESIENMGETSPKARRRRLKQLMRACMLAQSIAFCELDEIAYDDEYYKILDDMADDINTVKILHY